MNDLAILKTSALPIPAALAEMSTDQLRQELVRSLTLTAAHYYRAGMILRVLQERGEDMSKINIPLVPFLLKIAYGQTVDKLVARYAGSPSHLERLSALPLADQSRIAEGQPVEMVVKKDDGEYAVELKDPIKMTRVQSLQVFGRGCIRDKAEQIIYLEDKRTDTRSHTKKSAKPEKVAKDEIRADRQRDGLWFGKQFHGPQAIVTALSELSDHDDGADMSARTDLDKTVELKLTQAEYDSLKANAEEFEVSVDCLVRRALVTLRLLH